MDLQRFGDFVFLVHVDEIGQLFVHGLHDFHAAFFLQRVGQQGFKAGFLLGSRLRNIGAEYRLDKG